MGSEKIEEIKMNKGEWISEKLRKEDWRLYLEGVEIKDHLAQGEKIIMARPRLKGGSNRMERNVKIVC